MRVQELSIRVDLRAQVTEILKARIEHLEIDALQAVPFPPMRSSAMRQENWLEIREKIIKSLIHRRMDCNRKPRPTFKRAEPSIIRSDDDEQGPVEHFNEGDQVRLRQGERHRLIGLEDFGVVAEIWQHTKEVPSDEEDIVRVQDDFKRK